VSFGSGHDKAWDAEDGPPIWRVFQMTSEKILVEETEKLLLCPSFQYSQQGRCTGDLKIVK